MPVSSGTGFLLNIEQLLMAIALNRCYDEKSNRDATLGSIRELRHNATPYVGLIMRYWLCNL